MTKSYIVTNSGYTTQAIFIDGLAVDVAPGSEINIDNYDLTDERRAHYAARGVEFSDPEVGSGKKKRASKSGQASQTDDAARAIQAAEEAVAAAEKRLEEAGDDVDKKAAAEAELATATAALANLQASA